MPAVLVSPALRATLVIAILALCMPGVALAAPANDDFANATPFLDYGGRDDSSAGALEEATREPGEPIHGGVASGGSVWFRWTAQYSGPARIYPCHGNLHPTVSVYLGASVSALTAVGIQIDVGTGTADYCTLGGRGGVALEAVAGQTYSVAVAAGPGESGWFEVQGLDAPLPPTSASTPRIGRKVRIKGSRAKIRFQSTYGFATYLCQLDRGAKTPCTSPISYRDLKPGRHRFAVTAIGDPGAVVQPAAVRQFWIPRERSR
jgi:hypothetical protein